MPHHSRMASMTGSPRSVGVGRSALVLAWIGGALLALGTSAVGAAGRAIDDIRFSRQNGVAAADIVFSCPVRYVSHTPQTGAAIRVRLTLGVECLTTIGSGLRSELYDPPVGNMAGVNEVVFDTPEGREATLSIKLAMFARFTIGQGRTRNVLRISFAAPEPTVTRERNPAPPIPDTRAPIETSRPPPPAVARAPSETPRAPPPAANPPIRLVPRPEPPGERFVLTLASAEQVDAARAENLSRQPGDTLYISDFHAGSRQWQELRLGFFLTEREAGDRLAVLGADFPRATIAIADAAEQDRAQGQTLAARVDAPAWNAPAAAAPVPALSAERIAALVAEADEAMLASNYDRSVQIYTRLLEEPGFADRPEARERLGIARERKGQVAQAKSEYQAYLAEFPSGPDALRVQQRLAGLADAGATPQVQLEGAPSTDDIWDFTGGMAQYFRHDVLEPLDGQPETIRSILTTNVDLAVRRHGERFELVSHIDAAYHYDASETPDAEDQLYVSNAFVDVADLKHDWSARVGRQSLYGAGVLGRFDGAHASYQWRPDVALNITLGSPVEYPRHAIDSHRQFIGMSADWTELVKQWDMSFFAIAQQVDSIADRQAVGAEARYRGETWNVIGAIDVDLSYAVLNSALVTASWRTTDKLTLNGRYNFGAAPFLTTRNALIGQSVASIDELLETYSEAEVRAIARDRTAQVSTGTFGLSHALFDRFDLNLDLGYYETGATSASAGVAAVPASGTQTFFVLSVIGSSALRDGDTAIFTWRHSEVAGGMNDALIVDWRLPTSARFRLNPRLMLATRHDAIAGSDEWIAAPTLRMAMRWPRRHQFELELGARLTSREFLAFGAAFAEPAESTEYFFNAGYWWEF